MNSALNDATLAIWSLSVCLLYLRPLLGTELEVRPLLEFEMGEFWGVSRSDLQNV